MWEKAWSIWVLMSHKGMLFDKLSDQLSIVSYLLYTLKENHLSCTGEV